MRYSSRLLLAISTFSLSLLFSSHPVSAEINGRAVAEAGLVVHWEANLGGAALVKSERSVTLWPHSAHRHEYVDVTLNGRLLERIDANEIDKSQTERTMLAGTSITKSPRLGLAGARAKAEKLIKTYSVLNKRAEMSVVSEPLVYLLAATKNGIITALNAETGDVLWQTSVPHPSLPILGPGVSDEYVTVVNGNACYVFDLENGNLVATKKLQFTPTSAPVPLQGKVLIPSVGGRVVAYDIERTTVGPIVLRVGTENRVGTVVSPDREFIAWASQKSLYLVKNDRMPALWSRVNASEAVESLPIPVKDGFVFASHYGTVIRSTTTRIGSFVWRTSLPMHTSRAPIVGPDHVFILSDEGTVQSLGLSRGDILWNKLPDSVDTLIGTGKNHLYVKDFSGALLAIRIEDGSVASRASLVLPDVIPNSINDRFFFATEDGHLSCLREADAAKPTMFSEVSRPLPKAKAVPNLEAVPDSAKPASNDETDLFGDDLKGGEDKESGDMFESP